MVAWHVMKKSQYRRGEPRVLLPHNYCIVARGFPWACRCDDMEGPPMPAESYPTIEEAIARLPVLFYEVAKRCFDFPTPPGSVSVKLVLFDDVFAGKANPLAASKTRIIREFKKHPSVPLLGLIKFWEHPKSQIFCMLQGQKEIQAWLQTPKAQELSQTVRALNATAECGGIVVS